MERGLVEAGIFRGELRVLKESRGNCHLPFTKELGSQQNGSQACALEAVLLPVT